MESSLRGAGNPGRKRCLGRSADLDVSHFAALEDGKSRDGANAELGSQFRVFVDVELCDLDLAGKLRRNFFEARRDHFARAAPFGPEIHYDRFGGFEDFGLEVGGVDFYGSHIWLSFQ
ncbi:hypothetical protein AGR1A_Cc60322 [Agrobacterium fabacearum CFBP 5771]|nr:hypothetical protein AGR1A_Cc60322 [Agrobacterium fabacearum CFBP 5771]